MKETAKPTVAQTETAGTAIAPQPAFTRILALTDFSHKSQAAVEYATQLARSMHARLTLLHIFAAASDL
jgi:Universal stress protein family